MDKTVGVIGLGYVGLPLALTAAESGWNVVGFDKNVQLIENLSSSKSHSVSTAMHASWPRTP